MEALANINQFSVYELREEELIEIDGGSALKVFAGCMLFSAGVMSAIVGVGIAVGTAGVATGPALGLAAAGVTAACEGMKLINSGMD